MRYVLTIKGNWSELKSKLKNKYKNLTDSDLEYNEDKREEMMDGLRTKLGKTRQELLRILNTF
jgi:uncharacterized protein YjbJ (UPF0337 family)